MHSAKIARYIYLPLFLKLLIKSITHFFEVCNSIGGCCGLIEKKIWGLNIFYEFITIMILNQTSFIAYGK